MHAFNDVKYHSFSSMFRLDTVSHLHTVSTDYLKRSHKPTCVTFIDKLSSHFLQFCRTYYARRLHIKIKIKACSNKVTTAWHIVLEVIKSTYFYVFL
jgi:hypothetical protein